MVGTVHEFCCGRGVEVSVRYNGLQETYHGFIHVFCPFYFANFRNLPLFSKASPGTYRIKTWVWRLKLKRHLILINFLNTFGTQKCFVNKVKVQIKIKAQFYVICSQKNFPKGIGFENLCLSTLDIPINNTWRCHEVRFSASTKLYTGWTIKCE